LATPISKKTGVKKDKNEITTEIFEAFEKNTYYEVKTLAIKTGQTQPIIKTILDEIADRVPSGPFKGTYKLKADFIKKPEVKKKK